MRSLIAGALAFGIAAAGLLSAAPAKADDHHHWRGHGNWDHNHYRGPVFAPRPVVRYYPAPRYVYVPPPPPPPVYYYAPPPPVGLSLNFAIPLR